MHQQETPEAKLSSTEPEIIPPGAGWQQVSRTWASAAQHYAPRLWITPRGPVGFTLFVLLIVILAFAGIVLLFGAALVGIAATGVLIVGGIVSSVLRGQFRR
jgi:hypothetical protein